MAKRKPPRRRPSPAPEPAADPDPAPPPPREGTRPERPGFAPEALSRSTIALPLLELLHQDDHARAAGDAATPVRFLGAGPIPEGDEGAAPPPALHSVIIDLNLLYPVDGRRGAKVRVEALLGEVMAESGGGRKGEGIVAAKRDLSDQYLFCRLTADTIRALVAADDDPHRPGAARPFRPAIHHVWPDFPIRGQISRTVSTVKADAAQRSYAATGEGIVWAVVDSGIDRSHAHFQQHRNLELDSSIAHRDFTAVGDEGDPLRDGMGHGTHVAGIIAGALDASPADPITVDTPFRDEHGRVDTRPERIVAPISGMAPRCKLLSLKVLDDEGNGESSSVIAAIAHVQEINGNGRKIRVHGVNLSLGYDFDPRWFACGQSPLCVEVNRLVRSGVVVVVAAGNAGYGEINPDAPTRLRAAGLDQTINDPGNADLAITVGSTHRDMPHVYGVSYFSSKGPTGDGRYKPDLVAPGENIISCRSRGADVPPSPGESPAHRDYVERSGTSQATPHVSGVIAAFLSCRREFIGEPEKVKKIFLNNATDLDRTPYFQGKGLVDLMRAIQAV